MYFFKVRIIKTQIQRYYHRNLTFIRILVRIEVRVTPMIDSYVTVPTYPCKLSS